MLELHQEEHLENILSILVELGVSGATLLDSEGLGHFLAFEVPIFAGLRQMMGEKKTANKTILALINEDNFLAKFNKFLAEENIDFTSSGTGIMMTVPVNSAVTSDN